MKMHIYLKMIQIHPMKAMITVIVKTKDLVYHLLLNFHLPQKMKVMVIWNLYGVSLILQYKKKIFKVATLLWFTFLMKRERKVNHLLERFWEDLVPTRIAEYSIWKWSVRNILQERQQCWRKIHLILTVKLTSFQLGM